MQKLNVAIIGQGRSGKDIHGKYYLSGDNQFYNVRYVVETDPDRREIAKTRHPGCAVFADYKELLTCNDVDLVVNATYSDLHYAITCDLLRHKKNVLVEKPFARTRFECDAMIRLAKENGVFLAVFQQSNCMPFFRMAKDLMTSGKLGEIKEIKLAYNGLSRRWDWQSLQKRCAGNAYNTGPHPIGMALGLLDFDPKTRVAYSKLDNVLSSGDSDDFCKIILDTPGKPFADIEIHANDAYSPFNLKLLGTLGTFQATPFAYKMTYLVPGENPEKPVVADFLQDDAGNPIYCSEQLVKHEEEGTFEGAPFDIAAAGFYEEIYYAITQGKALSIDAQKAAQIISVVETVHAQNPLPVRF